MIFHFPCLGLYQVHSHAEIKLRYASLYTYSQFTYCNLKVVKLLIAFCCMVGVTLKIYNTLFA